MQWVVTIPEGARMLAKVTSRCRTSRWRRGLLVVPVAGAILLGASSPANAAIAWPSHPSFTSTTYNGGQSNVRACPNDDTCPIIFALGNGSTVFMLCWTDADWAFGNSWSNRWFYIQDLPGRQGFIHATLVMNQASSPHC
jgi:hypothetical protein